MNQANPKCSILPSAKAILVLGFCIICTVLMLWCTIVFESRMTVNSVVTALMAVQIQKEGLLNPTEARHTQAEFVRTNASLMECNLIRIVGFFKPEYSPRVELAKVVNVLTNESLSNGESLLQAQSLLRTISQSWALGNEDITSIWGSESYARKRQVDQVISDLGLEVMRFSDDSPAVYAQMLYAKSKIAMVTVISRFDDYSDKERQTIVDQLSKSLLDAVTKIESSHNRSESDDQAVMVICAREIALQRLILTALSQSMQGFKRETIVNIAG